MKTDDRHPGREEMIRAIRSGSISFKSHLKQCQACRQVFELLSKRIKKPMIEPVDPPMRSVYRHMAVPRMIESRHPARTMDGNVVFDSWSQLPIVQTRDSGYGVERRLRFRADRFTLEFVAEHQQGRWQFVARVYDGCTVTPEFILQVGKTKLVPEGHRCFFWSSTRPPRKIQLLSPSVKIVLDGLSW